MADKTPAGITEPITAPRYVPIAHDGADIAINPYVYLGSRRPSDIIDSPKISSVTSYAIKKRCTIGVFLSIFCESAHDIRIYLIFKINVVKAISIYDTPAPMRENAANSPAEVLLSADVAKAWNGVKPDFTAAIPSVNETAR